MQTSEEVPPLALTTYATACHCPNEGLKQKKLIYAKRIPGRELCSDYTTSWNDQEKTKELNLKRVQMLPNELDHLLKTVRSQDEDYLAILSPLTFRRTSPWQLLYPLQAYRTNLFDSSAHSNRVPA